MRSLISTGVPMNEVARWLSNPLVLVGLCAIVGGGLLLFVSWAFTGEYERGGRDSVHRRPRRLEPWHVEPTTQSPARHRLDDTQGRTTNLAGYAEQVKAARAMIPVPIARQGERTVLDGDHAGTTRRVRQVEEEDGEEEGGSNRERGEDVRRPVADGEEGGAYPEAARPVARGNAAYLGGHERFFRNTVTGEIIMVDGYGRRIEWDNGE